MAFPALPSPIKTLAVVAMSVAVIAVACTSDDAPDTSSDAGGQQQAAPQAQVLNDVIEAIPVVTAFGTDGVIGVVYDRRLDDRELLFDAHGADSLAMVDRETGSAWNRFRGEAVASPLRSSTLRRMPATNSFWFG